MDELRQQQLLLKNLKIDLDNSKLHKGKLLISANNINHRYEEDKILWKSPFSLDLYSGQRLHIKGDNGSGKTTLIELLTGKLEPTEGKIERSIFKYAYLDQEYALVNVDQTVVELAEQFNQGNLATHDVRMQLSRSLFSSDMWNINCHSLSGGEKMRLSLCCLTLFSQTPDLLILDEPTNNIDILGIQILIHTIKNYQGTLLVISHDKHFIKEIELGDELIL